MLPYFILFLMIINNFSLNVFCFNHNLSIYHLMTVAGGYQGWTVKFLGGGCHPSGSARASGTE